MSITATNDIENIKGEVTELENCMDKAATRIADLKTSEQEGRYKEVEGTIHLHNINSIGEGTDQHFRNLSHPEQLKYIVDIINIHTRVNQPASIEIFCKTWL